MTQIPWLDKLLYKNSISLQLRGQVASPILKIANERVLERQNEANGTTDNDKEKREPDLLDRFIAIKASKPDTPSWYAHPRT